MFPFSLLEGDVPRCSVPSARIFFCSNTFLGGPLAACASRQPRTPLCDSAPLRTAPWLCPEFRAPLWCTFRGRGPRRAPAWLGAALRSRPALRARPLRAAAAARNWRGRARAAAEARAGRTQCLPHSVPPLQAAPRRAGAMSGFSPELIEYLEGKISFEEFEQRREERKSREKVSLPRSAPPRPAPPPSRQHLAGHGALLCACGGAHALCSGRSVGANFCVQLSSRSRCGGGSALRGELDAALHSRRSGRSCRPRGGGATPPAPRVIGAVVWVQTHPDSAATAPHRHLRAKGESQRGSSCDFLTAVDTGRHSLVSDIMWAV